MFFRNCCNQHNHCCSHPQPSNCCDNHIIIVSGPTGATGPNFGLAAYGGRYSDAPQTINLTLGGTSQVGLPTVMPVNNITTATANTLTLTQAGTYKIDYFLNASVAIGTTLTMSIRANGTDIPGTIISRLLSVGVSSLYSGSIIVTLAAGTNIDMALSALLAVGVTLGTGTNASLTVTKISA